MERLGGRGRPGEAVSPQPPASANPRGLHVISGGQAGVDQAALAAAQDAGLEVGGWCPPGRVCEGGTIPSRFPLMETPVERSPEAPEIPRSLRTEWNVRDAVGTLVLIPRGMPLDPGTAWTLRCAERYVRPVLVCDPRAEGAAAAILDWISANGIRILNVAGPSEGQAPGIGEQVYRLLRRVFAEPR